MAADRSSPSLLRKILTAPFFLAGEAFEIAYRLFITIPLMHFRAFGWKPNFTNAFGIFILGPLVGMGVFLLNPNSLLLGIAAGAISTFVFPALSFSALVGVGMAANLLTGLVQSQMIRRKNQKALAPHWENWQEKRDKNDTQGASLAMMDVIAERDRRIQAGFFGPLPRALYYNFSAANCITGGHLKPYVDEKVMVTPLTGFAPPPRPK